MFRARSRPKKGKTLIQQRTLSSFIIVPHYWLWLNIYSVFTYVCVQQPCKLIGTKRGVYTRKELVCYNMDAVRLATNRPFLNPRFIWYLPRANREGNLRSTEELLERAFRESRPPYHCFETQIGLLWRHVHTFYTISEEDCFLSTGATEMLMH